MKLCPIVLVSGLLIFVSCRNENNVKQNPSQTNKFQISYAQGFTVKHYDSVKWVEVTSPYQGATNGYKYLLVRKGAIIPPHDDETIVIPIPIETIVCTSTTHIPLLDYLKETNKLIGFPTTDYISSKTARDRIETGNIIDLGIDKGMNLEKLFELSPDMVMGYTMTADIGQFKKILEVGIPVVINAEYLEKHPLGRSEWIKFMSLFFDKEKEADSVFQLIEQEYVSTKNLLSGNMNNPSVMSGVVYGDTWFLPGGKNYAATILSDAGFEYLWKENHDYGFLELSFESVYQTALNADYWIGSGSFASLEEMKKSESRYALFKPFQSKKIYSYNLRKGAKGGNEFLELGYLRPDFILKDLVKIGHPELLPDYQLYFYSKLE